MFLLANCEQKANAYGQNFKGHGYNKKGKNKSSVVEGVLKKGLKNNDLGFCFVLC